MWCPYPDLIGNLMILLEKYLVDLLDNEQFKYFCDLLTAGKISDDR